MSLYYFMHLFIYPFSHLARELSSVFVPIFPWVETQRDEASAILFPSHEISNHPFLTGDAGDIRRDGGWKVTSRKNTEEGIVEMQECSG